MNQNQQDIEEHLLLQFLLGNADEALTLRVEEWLAADNRNRDLLDRLESLWLETGRISPPPVAVDVDAAWERVNSRIGKSTVKNPFSSRYFWAAAASVLLVAGIFAIFRFAFSPNQIRMAAQDKVLSDSLPDGSSITLNTNSTLIFPETFDDEIRKVKLTGEAFFEVKHDEAQPFVVDAGLAEIRVLGTSFAVKAYPGKGVEVVVSEGRVMLYRVDARSGDTLSLILTTGERGFFDSGMQKPVQAGAVDPDGLFWANRSLDFRRSSLLKVFNVLENYYQIKVRVSDPAILNCLLTASFVNEPPDRIMSVIAESFGLQLQGSGQVFQLTGAGCDEDVH
jgi:ferric-dicitrate binding protein FerR (iron transport regulator)